MKIYTSSLIDSFSDKVSREMLFKCILVLKRIVRLSKRHTARFEPAIENFWHSSQNALSFLRRDSDLIDEFLVNIRDIFDATELFQLVNRADTNDLL